MQRQQKGKNLEGKRNMASLGLGAGIGANTQGGVVSGGKGEGMQGSQRRSEYWTKGRLEQTGWKVLPPGPVTSWVWWRGAAGGVEGCSQGCRGL